MTELTKSEKFDLAMQGEEVRPDWIPDVQWRGKMTGALADFCTSMIAAGHPDTEIHRICEQWFGGPASVTPIRRLHDTHAAVIAEKLEHISRQMANIPIAHRVYRLQVLNRMLMELTDKFHDEVQSETPSNVEKLTRSIAKITSEAREETGGRDVKMQQNNIYIEAVNKVNAEDLSSLQKELTDIHSKLRSALGEGEEAVDAEFEAEDDE